MSMTRLLLLLIVRASLLSPWVATDSETDFEDVEQYRPGTIEAYRNWWTVSCVTSGKLIISPSNRIDVPDSTTRLPEGTSLFLSSDAGTRMLPSRSIPSRSLTITGLTLSRATSTADRSITIRLLAQILLAHSSRAPLRPQLSTSHPSRKSFRPNPSQRNSIIGTTLRAG